MSYTFQERIIPTYVGSTSGASVRNLNKPNHSHVCGINGDRPHDHQPGRRIIPTYVGSTPAEAHFKCIASNHSHVCGINPIRITGYPYTAESFPRMWDQRGDILTSVCQTRIIPTYVGSTQRQNHSSVLLSNHSHVCGINRCLGAFSMSFSESFPRMWDQSRKQNYKNDLFSNHSHVCGINAYPADCGSRYPESFPRMWDQHTVLP